MNNTMNNGTLNEYSVSYTANGIENKYYHPFTGVYVEQIQVFVNSVLIDRLDPVSGYGVDTNTGIAGGYVFFNNVLKVGTKILICENLTFKRVVNFFASSSFTAKDLNVEFNNVYKILGILNANSVKTLRINNSDSVQDIADLKDGVIIKKGDDVITKSLDIDRINAKLDDVSHKYDDIKVSLIKAFNKISSTPVSGGANVITNALVSQNNLNDVMDPKEARKNLGLSDLSTLSKITSAYTDDSILKQDLENISDPAKARINLGLSDMVTMSKADVLTLINDKIATGFDIPAIHTSVYSIKGDFKPKVNLMLGQYQKIPFISDDFLSSDDTLLYVTPDGYDLHIKQLGTYILSGFISLHRAYNMVAKIEVLKEIDATPIDNIISNHIYAGVTAPSPGVCLFNDILMIQDPIILRLFIQGDSEQTTNLMLDANLDADYLSKFTIHRIIGY